jgi:alpha-1,2-mannosyltransferase
VARGRRWGGVGVGLATAVKLTPGVFIVYLLVTGRWRAAATAAGAATAATLLSAAVAPEASREFWTAALWNTDRVGNLAYVSNQSLRGLVARQLAGPAESTIWLLLVLAALAVWVWRARAAAAAGDEFGGLAVTGVLGCLISPVSWVHHLVWLLPALIRVVEVGWFAPRGSRGRWLLYAGVAGYLLVTSRLTFVWETAPRPPLAVVGSNLYVWLSIGLLLAMPIRSRTGLPPTGPPPTGPPPTGPPPGRDLPGGDLSVGGASIPVDGRT